MEQQVNAVCRSSYGQLRKIGRIRRYLSSEASKSLVNGLVTSRMDYCNALLHGLPNALIDKLQRVQNTAARIITRTPRHSHITPVLRELHWLPIQYRIQYKILVHTYNALNDRSPLYITDMLNIYRPSRTLRSQNTLTLVTPRIKTAKYGQRCYKHTHSRPTWLIDISPFSDKCDEYFQRCDWYFQMMLVFSDISDIWAHLKANFV